MFDVQTVLAGAVMAMAGFWCWDELRRTTRHWRSATFITVVIAVGAIVTTELIAGRQRGFNLFGAGMAVAGWCTVALVARLRRRR